MVAGCCGVCSGCVVVVACRLLCVVCSLSRVVDVGLLFAAC